VIEIATMTTENTSPFFASVFPKQIGRLSYVLRFLFLVVVYELGIYAINQCPNPTLRAIMIIAFVLLFLVYLFGFIVMPRLRDFGLPSLALILFFIPILNTLLALGLIFAPQNYWQKMRRKTQ